MKVLTPTLKTILYSFAFLFCAHILNAQVTIDSENFESGWAIGNDGDAGSTGNNNDCDLDTNPNFTNTQSVHLRDDSGASSTTFSVTFNPSTGGSLSTDVSIPNTDSDENPYNFTINGTATVPPPEYTIYYENFDENNGFWVASTGSTTNWAHGTGLTAVSELGEGNYWFTNNYNNYSDNSYATVESPIISTLGYNNIVFSTDIRYNLDKDEDDGVIVEYRKNNSGVWTAWTILGANGEGTNWYDGNGNVDAIALGSDGWTGDTGTQQTIQNFFETATISVPNTLNDSAEIQFRFVFASDAGTTDDGAAFDNILIYGDPITPFSNPVIGPGSINSELKLWLKATAELGVATNGTDINVWNDQAFDNDAIGLSSNSPSFEDNNIENINFNPVIKFDRSSKEFLRGKGGYFSHDYFVVMKSNGVIDNTGTNRQVPIAGRVAEKSPHFDGTGLGLGSISARFNDEVVAHMKSSVPQSPDLVSYGKAYTSTTDSYVDEVIIYNIKSNAARTETEIYKNGIRIDNTVGQSVIPSTGTFTGTLNFSEFINQQYYLGVGRFSLNGNIGSYVDGKITEIVSYSNSNTILNQQKIQSYLAIKNGVTLHAPNSVTQLRLNDVNYIDSAGDIIWDTTADGGAFNYDIAGIGRDSISALNQKQSKSVNPGSIVTIGLNDIALTNSANTNNFANDRDFLVWGSNNGALAGSNTITINLGAALTSVTTIFDRRWKIVETCPNGTKDILDVKISIPTSAFLLSAPAPDFITTQPALIVSSTSNFSDVVDVIPLKVNGTNYETWYDFDGVRYFTFGIATKVAGKFDVEYTPNNFLVGENSVNLNTNYTVSAWVRNLGTGGTFVSKKGAYDFRINATGNIEVAINGALQLTSNTLVNDAKWHQIAVTDNGAKMTLYIDGIDDNFRTTVTPVASSGRFAVGVVYTDKNNITTIFNGDIDEIRVWDRALTQAQIQYIMNQEILKVGANVNGAILPSTVSLDVVNSIPWSEVKAYHNINSFYGTTIVDASGNNNWLRIKYLVPDKVITDFQTAPLPYVSDVNGNWDENSTWVNGTMQTIPGATSIVDNTKTVDWNIVQISSDVNLRRNNILLPGANNGNRNVLGLIVDNTFELTAEGTTNMTDGTDDGNGLTVTHYLGLNGTIDLEGGSQLIQTQDSDLDVSSTGELHRDQQGTKNSFNYNYWSLPVSKKNTLANNVKESIKNSLFDGDLTINFVPGAYSADGNVINPVIISSRWLYKFYGKNDDYDSWIRISENTEMLPGEGYTMKGTSGTAELKDFQNYVFKGKPNNGDITLELEKTHITPNGDVNRLIGNPYPSAIDANEFIKDNLSEIDGGKAGNTDNVFNGALYFWDHFGEKDTHILKEYVGGYATRNLTAGAPAISNDSRIDNSGDPSNNNTVGKEPGQYIPVGQGFFVNTAIDSLTLTAITSIQGGFIRFKNSQRVFQLEGYPTGKSVFMKGAPKAKSTNAKTETSDTYPIIRLLYDSPTGYHRQIVVGKVENTTNNFDLGYDAPMADVGKEDMFWLIQEGKFVIQGVNNFDTDQELPLGLIVSKSGLARIKIDKLENIDENISLHIKDNLLGKTHNISQKPFEINLEPGTYTNRFSLIFKFQKLVTEDVTAEVLIPAEAQLTNEDILVFMNNTIGELQIKNTGDTGIQSVTLYNYLGQTMKTWNSNLNKRTVSLPINVAAGVYIVQINTTVGKIVKKIIIE